MWLMSKLPAINGLHGSLEPPASGADSFMAEGGNNFQVRNDGTACLNAALKCWSKADSPATRLAEPHHPLKPACPPQAPRSNLDET